MPICLSRRQHDRPRRLTSFVHRLCVIAPWFPWRRGGLWVITSGPPNSRGWQCPFQPVVQAGYRGALLKLQGQGQGQGQSQSQGQGQGQDQGQGQGQGGSVGGPERELKALSSLHRGFLSPCSAAQGPGQGQGQNLSGPYGQESGLRAGLLILIVFFIARGSLPPRAHNIGIRLKLIFTKICTEGVRTYVDLTVTLSRAPIPRSIVRSLS
jgi:hypothetical protein